MSLDHHRRAPSYIAKAHTQRDGWIDYYIYICTESSGDKAQVKGKLEKGVEWGEPLQQPSSWKVANCGRTCGCAREVVVVVDVRKGSALCRCELGSLSLLVASPYLRCEQTLLLYTLTRGVATRCNSVCGMLAKGEDESIGEWARMEDERI